MALAITSFTPSGGPTTGGTPVTITGTELDTVDAVLFGAVEGSIDTTQVNTATTLHVLSPAIANDGTLVVKIEVLDNDLGREAQSSTSYTYTTVTSPPLATISAAKWVLQVDGSVAQDGSDWVAVRGITNFVPSTTPTTQDDTDYDSVDPTTQLTWGSDIVLGLKWGLQIEMDRKVAAGYTEDPGQAVIRARYDKGGTASLLHARWFDRNGGPEAFEGTGTVTWTEKGGTPTDKSTVTVNVMGRGIRKTITNPA